MKPTLAAHRAYFFVVFWFTLWVGFFGFFRPQEILRALPWPVPPLHARFIGAIYLAATAFLALSFLSRSLLKVRTIVRIAFWWTGWLLLVTVLHWKTFDFERPQVWFWVVAYIAFPLGAAWLAWAPSRSRTEPERSAVIGESWVIVALWVEGVVFVALALVSFFLPSIVVGLWPWKLAPFLAQVYSGPLLGLGIGCLALARRRNWPETLLPAVGLLVASALAIVASLRHLALFAPGSPSKIVWFTTLALIAMVSAVLVARSFSNERKTRTP